MAVLVLVPVEVLPREGHSGRGDGNEERRGV